jgi:hypothetical protein
VFRCGRLCRDLFELPQNPNRLVWVPWLTFGLNFLCATKARFEGGTIFEVVLNVRVPDPSGFSKGRRVLCFSVNTQPSKRGRCGSKSEQNIIPRPLQGREESGSGAKTAMTFKKQDLA